MKVPATTSGDLAAQSEKTDSPPAFGAAGLTFCLLFAALVIYLSDRFLSGAWQIAGIIAGLLVALGGISHISEARQQKQAKNRFAEIFPGYAGECFPISALLHYEGPEGKVKFDPNGVEFSLGVAERDLFFVRCDRRDESSAVVVTGPDGRALRLCREDIAHVQVEAFSDSEIASQVDSAEWWANLIFGQWLGGSMRTIPWAAFVFILEARPEGPATFLIGVPTEFPSDELQRLASMVTAAASGVAQEAAVAEISAMFGEAVGQDAADLLGGVGFVSAFIGSSTDGRKGRLMAALLATRIRQLATSLS